MWLNPFLQINMNLCSHYSGYQELAQVKDGITAKLKYVVYAMDLVFVCAVFLSAFVFGALLHFLERSVSCVVGFIVTFIFTLLL